MSIGLTDFGTNFVKFFRLFGVQTPISDLIKLADLIGSREEAVAYLFIKSELFKGMPSIQASLLDSVARLPKTPLQRSIGNGWDFAEEQRAQMDVQAALAALVKHDSEALEKMTILDNARRRLAFCTTSSGSKHNSLRLGDFVQAGN